VQVKPIVEHAISKELQRFYLNLISIIGLFRCAFALTERLQRLAVRRLIAHWKK
jgi:hypothetical protein